MTASNQIPTRIVYCLATEREYLTRKTFCVASDSVEVHGRPHIARNGYSPRFEHTQTYALLTLVLYYDSDAFVG